MQHEEYITTAGHKLETNRMEYEKEYLQVLPKRMNELTFPVT
jgi:hypothetical protein